MEWVRSLFSGAKGRVVTVLAVLLLILALLPVALQFYLRYTIAELGLGEATISDIDLNLFAGTFELENLELDQGGEITLVLGRVFLNYGWFGLGLTEFDVEELTLEDSRLVIRQDEEGTWYVLVPLKGEDGSQPIEPADVEEQGIALPKITAQRISLSNVELDVSSSIANGTFRVDSFELTRLSSFSEEPAFLTLDASWNNSRIEFDWTAEIIKGIPRLEGDVRISEVQLSEFLPILGEPFSRLEGVVDIDLKVDAKRTPERGLSVAGEGSVGLKGIAVDYQQFQASIESIEWQGRAALDVENPVDSLQQRGDIALQVLQLALAQDQLALLSLDKLTVAGLQLDGLQQISVDQVQFEALDLLRPQQAEQADLRTGLLSLTDLSLVEQQQLEIAAISITDGQYHVVLDKSGELALQSMINRLSPAEPKSESAPDLVDTDEAESGAEMTVKLDRMELLGESYIAFEDRQFDPVVKAKFSIDEFSLLQLDQQLPEQKSPLKLHGRFDEFSSVVVEGWSKPFLEHKDTAITGALKTIELPPFSPYVESATGYHINSGQLDHEFTINIQQQILEMSNIIKLSSFELEEMDAEKTADASKSMGVSLGLGLDLMRDGDGNIELDVPIKGGLDDPNLHLNTVLSQAMGKAITKGSISFLKYAIQPYGAIMLAGEQLHKQMSRVDLEPVIFQPTDELLPVQLNDYLDKLYGLLEERPGLSLKLCGVTSLGDEAFFTEHNLSFDDKSLQDLAKTRSVAVKRYFVERGVESGRLALCKAQIHDPHIGGVKISL